MEELSEVRSLRSARSKTLPNLLEQYGCGPIQFSGTNDALYERHLLFDDIIAPTAAGARERFEAAARSVRDVLSQRRVRTDSQEFSGGDFVGALAGALAAQSLTRVLYSDDSTSTGQALHFVQEYFLVACSLADLVRRLRHSNADWSMFPDKVAIQLNDTHPTMAVPELMRIPLDEAHVGWDQAWDLTQRTLAYTNDTLLPEALEKWPPAWFEMPLPEIIFEINQFLDTVRTRFPGDEDRNAPGALKSYLEADHRY